MPILKQETKEITLPESGAKIKILTKLTFGTILKFQETNNDGYEMQLELAANLITDWDLTNEKNEKLPITKDIIKNLGVNDGNFLISEIGLIIGEKKN